uniref:Sulfotransferase n=1 Tax=Alexandrium catenella TaxID=2925 RepID=A0A7S1QTZ7_ALECA
MTLPLQLGLLAWLVHVALPVRGVAGVLCPGQHGLGPAQQDAVLRDADPDAVGLLQRRAAALALKKPRDMPPALKKIAPITWVHVPKCGSSFINTLIHLPGVCNSAIPEDLYVSMSTFGVHFLSAFGKTWDVWSNCLGLERARFGHRGIGESGSDYYAEREGTFMIMLRGPEQRLLSAWKDMRGASKWGVLNDDLMDPSRSWGGWPTTELPTPSVFAEYARGCAVRMLTRPGLVCGGAGGPPREDEVELAVERLRTGFSFVGLTDQWALSMCLFDAMFHTGCSPLQFEDARPGPDKRNNSTTGYEEDRLHGITDPYDEKLYAEAVKIFKANLERYNVSEASCQPCWQVAGVAPDTAELGAFYEDESEV